MSTGWQPHSLNFVCEFNIPFQGSKRHKDTHKGNNNLLSDWQLQKLSSGGKKNMLPNFPISLRSIYFLASSIFPSMYLFYLILSILLPPLFLEILEARRADRLLMDCRRPPTLVNGAQKTPDSGQCGHHTHNPAHYCQINFIYSQKLHLLASKLLAPKIKDLHNQNLPKSPI